MITRVHRRGKRVGGLLRYLYGPGKREEHVDPRLVAAWDGAGPLSELEPPITATGKRDFRRLIALLEQPVRAGRRPPARPVWHCSMRLAPEDRDRVLPDAVWGRMAREMLTEAGLIADGDDAGLRWIAVRHSDDHIHIVATLVREDGRTHWARNDYPRCVAATYTVARRYGLRRRVPPADRTAHRRPYPAEVSKARRKGWAYIPRDELRRRVRTAAAAATDEIDFFARLTQAGVLVRLRRSHVNPQEITGYAVALPGAHTGDGRPVYYSGGRLAADLTLPKLRRRWATSRPPGPRMGPVGRTETLWQAAAAVRAAAEQVRQDAHQDPASAQATALAVADVLTSLACAREGRQPGDLHRAAEVFDRAARGPQGRETTVASRAGELRAMSRLIALVGRISGEKDGLAVLALVLEIARFAEALEHLRAVQQRAHQAEAARVAAAQLRAWAAAGTPPTPTPRAVVPDLAMARPRQAVPSR